VVCGYECAGEGSRADWVKIEDFFHRYFTDFVPHVCSFSHLRRRFYHSHNVPNLLNSCEFKRAMDIKDQTKGWLILTVILYIEKEEGNYVNEKKWEASDLFCSYFAS
jgi:hypothetical protein